MASALSSSNALSISTGLYSKPDSKTLKPTVTVHAKTQSIESQSPNEGLKKANRFNFNFSKIPDAKSLIPVVTSSSTSLFASPRRKDPNTVFVAGATGQSGTRIAQTLLRQGFAVRAGVPELSAAQELARLASTYKIISPAESKRLNAVESTFDDPESIAKAIGPATKVVITIGSGENGPTADVTTNDALRVIKAAELAGVGHVAVVYNSTGATISSGPSSTYNVLDGITSFFSNFSSLFSGAKQLSIGEFLSKAVETDVSYTLIKAALTEDYSDESSHGIVVSKEGTTIESKVAKSQIAKLVADVFSNTEVAENKVVEVSTSPSATSKSVAELFSAIPEDGRRKAYAEAMAKAKEEEEALIASEKAREAAKAAKKLEKEVKKLSDKEAEAATRADEAKAKAEAAGFSLDNLLTKAKDLSSSAGGFSFEKLSSQVSTAVSQKADKGDDELKIQIATVRGRTKARSLLPQKAVVKKATNNAKPKKPEPKSKPDKEEEEKVEVRNLFGGLFKQETIYIDDD